MFERADGIRPHPEAGADLAATFRLPEAVVERFTLGAGKTAPAVSLYLDVGADLALRGHQTRLESVPVVANLRHHDIEPLFNERYTGCAE